MSSQLPHDDGDVEAEYFGIEKESAENDCPELHFGIGEEDGEVVVTYCHAISFMYMTPENALRYAGYITQAANMALEKQKSEAPIQ